MTRVELSLGAVDDLDRMIVTHSLPADTRARVRRSLGILGEFPLVGRPLEGRWEDLRLLIGPWRWLLIVYDYEERRDLVVVVAIQDARSSAAATSA
ncbi:MAG TPA: type II toxin-antitoxin system RelE/ParE family toxin [Solirubrobacteraceae bacterium]|nr:type II toxin-antitoxin system RelE/ParE family toxin [Solirubrobacteraceae bacterium]